MCSRCTGARARTKLLLLPLPVRSIALPRLFQVKNGKVWVGCLSELEWCVERGMRRWLREAEKEIFFAPLTEKERYR